MFICRALHRRQGDVLVKHNERVTMRNRQCRKIGIGYLVVAENLAEVDAFVSELGNIVRPEFVVKFGGRTTL